MKDYLEKHEWKVIERGFHKQHNKITESIFSIGNGYMGQRGNFEEYYSGESMQGSYLAGIYYPDKTRVGWWKNGYPEYFAKVLNSVNWIAVDIYLDGKRLDLAKVEMLEFYRELDMQSSILKKRIKFKTSEGYVFKIESERFCSRATRELGCIQYKIRSENYKGPLSIRSYLDFDVYNEDANYDEQFWSHLSTGKVDNKAFVESKTRKTDFQVLAMMSTELNAGGLEAQKDLLEDKLAGVQYDFFMESGEQITLNKSVVIVSSFYEERDRLKQSAESILRQAENSSYDELRLSHVSAWDALWQESDIKIEGDVSAQQGIRFNIFHLHQTYSGDDARLNIGPKGFTGEKYGGSTYWDTEAYCLPFYLANSDPEVSRKLLKYRHNHLSKAIENAEKLGFKNGAALYPMVTMNGEECHNEWEITFEEIHRNGAIAYAIHDYTLYTGDNQYWKEYGIDVLVGIARFWAQRVNWSEHRKKYVMLGVTGPNEYENNVNNNWYTNYIARWCLKYCLNCLRSLEETESDLYRQVIQRLDLKSTEFTEWERIIDQMYLPEDKERQIFLQQDGFLDKELIPVEQLDDTHLPLNQNWSWDRILRSCYIKQADVLQGIYFFEEDFDLDTIQRNYDFYEPLTVHESSLSPCVHAILACCIGRPSKAYELYLRTARLDLDDYNNDTEDGLHITSMAGTWMSIVKGFAGMKIKGNQLSFDPFIPKEWKSYSFRIKFRSRVIDVKITAEDHQFKLSDGEALDIMVNGQIHKLN
jgi:maltose phosphorylase